MNVICERMRWRATGNIHVNRARKRKTQHGIVCIAGFGALASQYGHRTLANVFHLKLMRRNVPPRIHSSIQHRPFLTGLPGPLRKLSLGEGLSTGKGTSQSKQTHSTCSDRHVEEGGGGCKRRIIDLEGSETRGNQTDPVCGDTVVSQLTFNSGLSTSVDSPVIFHPPQNSGPVIDDVENS